MRRFIRFWKTFAQQYQRWYLLGIVCLVVTNALTVSIPTLIQLAIDALDAGEGLTGAGPWALTILLVGLSIMVVRTLSRTLFFNPGRTIEFKVKASLFDHLLAQPQRFFQQFTPGEIISRGTNDTSAMRALVGFATLQLFNVAFTLAFSIGRMAYIDLWLTIYCLIPLALGSVIMRVAVSRLYALQAQMLKQIARLSERILESYAGNALLQTYGALPGAHTRFAKENQFHLELGERIVLVRNWVMPIVAVLGQLCVVIVLLLGGKRVIDGELTIGQLSAFIAYITILATGLRLAGFLIGSTQRGYIALGRLFELFDTRPKRGEEIHEVPATSSAGIAIQVDSLTFRYSGADTPALKDVNFAIHAGETIGIFGHTGAGKTTLLKCLARYHEPDAGSVYLNGLDVTGMPIDSYWSTVALVPQEAFLFTRTIRENIAVADMPSEIKETTLATAVRDASLSTDLARLPDGLMTIVGERGLTLSGGQRQRSALARTLYRDFNLLLLDDVMSAVDHDTEKRLIEAIYQRAMGQTTVIVSHRISVLAQADRILVVEDGTITQQGNHNELMSRPGIYADAWRLQASQDRARASLAGGGYP